MEIEHFSKPLRMMYTKTDYIGRMVLHNWHKYSHYSHFFSYKMKKINRNCILGGQENTIPAGIISTTTLWKPLEW